MKTKFLLSVALIAGLAAGRAAETAKVPSDIGMEADIIYKTVNGEPVRLDLYRVKGRTYDKAPLLVWIHGGGFVQGSKSDAVKHNLGVMVPLLEEQGYLVASVEYRFCSVGGPHIADSYADCKDAVRFLMKHAEKYGIDRSRVVAIGSSAGAGVALMLAYSEDAELRGDPDLADTPARVRAAVSYFGVTDFKKRRDDLGQGDTKKLLLFGGDVSDHYLESISPVALMQHHARKVPALLIHGEKDPVVPIGQSAWMKAEADRLGWPVEFIPVKNMRHGFQPAGGAITPPLDEIWRTTVAYIVKANAR